MLTFISVFKKRSLSIIGGETRLIQGQRRRKGLLMCHVISSSYRLENLDGVKCWGGPGIMIIRGVNKFRGSFHNILKRLLRQYYEFQMAV